MISRSKSSRQALIFIFSFIKKNKTQYLIGISMLVLVDIFQLIIPKITQRVLDLLSEQKVDTEHILPYIGAILLLGIAMVITRFFWRLGILGSARRIESAMRETLFSHLQSLSFSFFNRSKTGDLMALLINDLNTIRMTCGQAFIGFIDAVFLGSLSLIFMATTHLWLTLIVILPLPLIALVMGKAGKLLHKLFKEVQESFSNISAHTQESFSGVRVIKGFAQENAEATLFEGKCNDYIDKNMRLIRIWGFFFPAITFLASVSIAMVYLVGGRYLLLQSITLGQFVSFTFYINLLIWPMTAIGMVYNIIQRGIASAERVLELLKTVPEIKDTPEVDTSKKTIQGSIFFNSLSFTFPQKEQLVLKGIDLRLPPGTSLGIMGKPGSGKTTLVSLLCRLYSIEKNAILIDGVDIHSISLDLIRRSIGYVPQDSFLFSETLENNISFGLAPEYVTQENLRKCSEKAAIYDEIMRFPDGFKTKVGERGITLSGGQKQRLAIARALMISPPILILDDALSAVDTATEREILNNLAEDIKKRTTIIIAHRISAVAQCDQIVVLEDGHIREQGNHETLIKKKGYYARLYKLQKLEAEILHDPN